MSKTIKQIADEIGVSKQAVHQKRRKEPLSTALQPFTETVDGIIYISVDGENLIKQAFFKDEPSTNGGSVDVNSFTAVDGEITAIITVLKQQLEVKDKQIAEHQQTIRELTAALENTTSSLKAAHALHAGTMQEHLESLPLIGEEQHGRKDGFFSRLFGGHGK